jgi:hypothetical protein
MNALKRKYDAVFNNLQEDLEEDPELGEQGNSGAGDN